MRLDIRGRHFGITAALQTHVTRRIRFALGRFDHSIRCITVRVADVNGPRGGADKRCHLYFDVVGRPIAIEELDRDLYVAIDRAAERAGRAAERALARQRAA